MPPDTYHPPADQGLELLYQDDHLLAVDKPSGLLCVPGRGEHKQDCLSRRVQQRFSQALTVHRLDMGTSGIVIFALNRSVQGAVGKLFEQRLINKGYLAMVSGQLSKTSGEISLPLICDWPNRPRQMIDRQRGKVAMTHYQVMSYDAASNSTRVELTPITGRSHQLRVHMSAIGHPILGDQLYADNPISHQSNRLLLHATQINLTHPATNQPLTISSPPPF